MMRIVSPTTSRPKKMFPKITSAGAATLLSLACCNALYAAVEIFEPRDTLDTAVAGPSLLAGSDANAYNFTVADHEYYDSNVYRLPKDLDVHSVVNAGASRSDWYNVPEAGFAGQWGWNRQIFDVGLDVQENRYANNTALNNLATNDHVIWNYGLGGVISGQVGATYLRDLVSFVNATGYAPTIYEQQQYFGTLRYQAGPHWTVYGGILDTVAAVAQANANDSRTKAVDLGAEFATDADSTIGVDYRYTDARFPRGIVVASVTDGGLIVPSEAFDPDFREDRLRFLLKRPLTDKTTLDVALGYLRRDYANSAIGGFSGPTWRGTLGWAPTEKTQLQLTTYRNLQAYLNDQSNYFRATGVSLTPLWNPTERVAVSVTFSRESQSYIGSSTSVTDTAARHDTINGQIATVSFTATRSLFIDASIRHEQRGSNIDARSYNDSLASLGAKFVF
jgi:hypothetical protein